MRLRIWETYTDANRYVLTGSGENAEFVWDRSFGRPRNAVVLPAGWRAQVVPGPGLGAALTAGRAGCP